LGLWGDAVACGDECDAVSFEVGEVFFAAGEAAAVEPDEGGEVLGVRGDFEVEEAAVLGVWDFGVGGVVGDVLGGWGGVGEEGGGEEEGGDFDHGWWECGFCGWE